MAKAGEGRRIGIMGGTFDPIHLAHLSLAECAIAYADLTELWFMPAGNPYFHKHIRITPMEDRNRMVELALQGKEAFSLSRFEQETEGPTYTAMTLHRLHALYPDARFYFLIGADQLYMMENWYHPEEVFRAAVLLVARREFPGKIRSFHEQIAYLTGKYQAEILPLPFSEMEISSTRIRELCARGEDISPYVPKAVGEYILEHGLYR